MKDIPERFPKLNLEGFFLMDDQQKCPNCNAVINDYIDCIGWGDYPAQGVGRFAVGHDVGKSAIAYECPECFEKCCHHTFIHNDIYIHRFLYEQKMENIKKGIDMETFRHCGDKSKKEEIKNSIKYHEEKLEKYKKELDLEVK